MVNGTLYDEIYAKLILEYFMPDRFCGLRKEEQPDLQGDYIAVEVTTAIPATCLESESLYSCLKAYELLSDKERLDTLDLNKSELDILKNEAKRMKNKNDILKRIAKNKGQLEHGHLYYHEENAGFENVLSAYTKKLKKLNSGNYTIFESQCLFIRDVTVVDKETLNETLDRFIVLGKDYEFKFDFVIICVPLHLYVFDLLKYMVNIIDFSFHIQCELSQNAMKLSDR